MNMESETLCDVLVSAQKKRIWACFIELIQEFDRLCTECRLTYWVFAGGLLGAVRHKGFIPWDDDIDVLMPRADFDRLQSMTTEEFGTQPPYFLQNFTTEPVCAQSLIRFRRSDTTDVRDYDIAFLKAHPELTPYNMGMNIAIFPVDKVPKSPIVRKLQQKTAYTLRGIFYRATTPAEGKRLQHALCRTASALLGGSHHIMRMIHSVYRAPRRTDPDVVQCFNGLYPTGNIWPASAFADAVWLPFEDITVRAPIGYHEILTCMYRDYMKFPPLEKRVEPHGGHTDPDLTYTEYIAQLKINGRKE